jgi:hypothetical protein
VVQLVRLLFLLYEFLLPHTKKAILGIGWVLRYLALGRGRTVWVATTSSLQHRRHLGWSLALGHVIAPPSSSRPALMLPCCLLSVYCPGTWASTMILERSSSRITVLAMVPQYFPLRGQVPN